MQAMEIGVKKDKNNRLALAFRAIEAVIEKDVQYGFPSCQLALRINGELVYNHAWGVQNTADPGQPPKPVGPLTLYDLASNTKMYSVNYALQYLHSWKDLDLDKPISTILGPRFYDTLFPINYEGRQNVELNTNRQWKQKLTIRQVLTHQGGFPADPRYFMKEFDFSRQVMDSSAENPFFISLSGKGENQLRNETLEAICRTPLMYEPGTQILYSDVDYMLLGFVVEELTGVSLDRFLRDTFWEPMGLSSITFNPWKTMDCWSQGIAATELHGNTRDGIVSFEGIRNETLWGQVHDEKAWYLMGGVSGHAGLFANAADLTNLASLMLTGQYQGKTYFLPETLHTFCAPVSSELDHWGLGWWRQGSKKKRSYYFGEEAGEQTIGHQGWTGTLTMIDPQEKLVLAVLTNKINTPVTDPISDPNTFEGEDFVTSTLGFAPRFLYAALESPDTSAAFKAILKVFDELIDTQRKNLKETCCSSVRALSAIKEAKDEYLSVF